MVDVAGIEPATPCLQSKQKFNLRRCFGFDYKFEALLRLLQSCSKNGRLTSSVFSRDVRYFRVDRQESMPSAEITSHNFPLLIPVGRQQITSV